MRSAHIRTQHIGEMCLSDRLTGYRVPSLEDIPEVGEVTTTALGGVGSEKSVKRDEEVYDRNYHSMHKLPLLMSLYVSGRAGCLPGSRCQGDYYKH